EKSPGKAKFFFIYPVGTAVDDLILFAIKSELCFKATGKFCYKKIVFTHKTYFFTIRREGGISLFAVGRKCLQTFGFFIVNKVVFAARVAVNLFGISAEQEHRFIRIRCIT